MRILFILLPIVSSDICQDFCVEQLGIGGCSPASHCENEHYCHGLFWTSVEKISVCFFTTGHGGECPDRYPVLCSEAVTRSETKSEPERDSSQTVSSSTITTNLIVSGNNTTTNRSQDFIFREQLLWREAGDVIALDLNATGFIYARVKYLNEGHNLGYWAYFDTGSFFTYSLVEADYPNGFTRSQVPWEPERMIRNSLEPISRVANMGEAYTKNPHIVPRDPGILRYGPDGLHRVFPFLGSIPEDICLFSGSFQFTFHEPRFLLVPPPGDKHRMLLGAGRNSPFAKAAGAFAVIPNEGGWRRGAKWQLLIGQNSSVFAEHYCASEDPRLRWYNLIPSLSDWYIPGHMWVGSQDGDWQPNRNADAIVERVLLYFDTGAVWVPLVTPVMMDKVVAEMEFFGPRRIGANTPYTRFDNCTKEQLGPYASNISSLHIQTGFAWSIVEKYKTIQFPIFDYIMFHEAGEYAGQCTLEIEISTHGGPNRVLIGPPFFSQVVSVFDNTNQRIGVCKRGDLPIQSLLIV